MKVGEKTKLSRKKTRKAFFATEEIVWKTRFISNRRFRPISLYFSSILPIKTVDYLGCFLKKPHYFAKRKGEQNECDKNG